MGCCMLHYLPGACVDVVYAFIREPAGMKQIASAWKLGPDVSLLGDGAGFYAPPTGLNLDQSRCRPRDRSAPVRPVRVARIGVPGQTSGTCDAGAKAFSSAPGPLPLHRVFPAAQ
jgi:hypothetical protein